MRGTGRFRGASNTHCTYRAAHLPNPITTGHGLNAKVETEQEYTARMLPVIQALNNTTADNSPLAHALRSLGILLTNPIPPEAAAEAYANFAAADAGVYRTRNLSWREQVSS